MCNKVNNYNPLALITFYYCDKLLLLIFTPVVGLCYFLAVNLAFLFLSFEFLFQINSVRFVSFPVKVFQLASEYHNFVNNSNLYIQLTMTTAK